MVSLATFLAIQYCEHRSKHMGFVKPDSKSQVEYRCFLVAKAIKDRHYHGTLGTSPWDCWHSPTPHSLSLYLESSGSPKVHQRHQLRGSHLSHPYQSSQTSVPCYFRVVRMLQKQTRWTSIDGKAFRPAAYFCTRSATVNSSVQSGSSLHSSNNLNSGSGGYDEGIQIYAAVAV